MAIPRSPLPDKSYPPHKKKRRPADPMRGSRKVGDATTESAQHTDVKR